MTAKGKINASKVQAGDRIIIDTAMHVYGGDECGPSRTKTGETVQVGRVLDKLKPTNARGYIIVTNLGRFYAEPIQTMWLAPEDNAGIKRAMAEAKLEDETREAAAPAAEEAQEAQEAPAADLTDEERAEVYNASTGTLDASADHAAATAECPNEWHATAPVRALILCPECPTVAPAPAGAAPAAADLLRALEPEVGHLLPPLAHGRELVRLADIAPSFFLTLDSHAGKVGLNSEDDRTEEPEMTATTETQATETETQPTLLEHTGSTVVALIERVWDHIRAIHPELPAVVVTTGSGELVKWGHFRPNSWKTVNGEKRHEFFLASEALAKGAHQVLQTTIHEAAHTLSNVRGVKDTSRQNRYHNGTFRKTAEELGLEHKGASPDKTHGFSFVTLTEATKVKYADVLAELESELKLTGLLPVWMGGEADEDERGGEKITKPKGGEEEGETKPKSGNLKATCGCEEPIIIRLSQKVLDLGVVRCDQCEELFTAA